MGGVACAATVVAAYGQPQQRSVRPGVRFDDQATVPRRAENQKRHPENGPTNRCTKDRTTLQHAAYLLCTCSWSFLLRPPGAVAIAMLRARAARRAAAALCSAAALQRCTSIAASPALHRSRPRLATTPPEFIFLALMVAGARTAAICAPAPPVRRHIGR